MEKETSRKGLYLTIVIIITALIFLFAMVIYSDNYHLSIRPTNDENEYVIRGIFETDHGYILDLGYAPDFANKSYFKEQRNNVSGTITLPKNTPGIKTLKKGDIIIFIENGKIARVLE